MIIGMSNCGGASVGISHKLVEPESNTEASDYITSNYKKLVNYIKSLGIKEEKAYDLLHDVYISVVEAEGDGRAYDIDYGVKNGTNSIMLVEQFVVGRIKLYSKNDKYKTDTIDKGNTKVERTVCIEVPVVNKKGYVYDRNGNILMEKRYIKEKTVITTSVCAASYEEGNDSMENNDSFQKAYAMAAGIDEIEGVTEYYSLKEQIDYCIDVGYLHDVNVLNIFKNIDVLSEMLGEQTRKRKKADSIFSKLSELVELHTDFAEALRNVIKYSATNKAKFELLLATY